MNPEIERVLKSMKLNVSQYPSARRPVTFSIDEEDEIRAVKAVTIEDDPERDW